MRGRAEPQPFPWADVLRFALLVLRWPPDTVWRATPREIAAALGRGGPEPPRAADLRALMLAFPDRPLPETPDAP